jgi:hypothetical protein
MNEADLMYSVQRGIRVKSETSQVCTRHEQGSCAYFENLGFLFHKPIEPCTRLLCFCH